ncbi:MAG TPA: hypothetical protein VF981_02955 [Gemmatimonadaceae bacterium]
MKLPGKNRIGAAFALLCLAALPLAAEAQDAALSQPLQDVKKLLEKYNDPIVAVHDGYLSSLGCIEYPKGGAEGAMKYAPGGMGVHFLNLGNVGPALDPAKPQVLIYEPVGDKLRLVAAEWFMPAEVAAGGKAPSIFGKELQGPMEGHKPLMPEGLHHYDLHVWLWKTNPEGVFSPTNPAVKCPKTGYSFAEDAPKMVHKHQ